MRELLAQQSLIQDRHECNHDDFETERMNIKKAITHKNSQFKARRIQCKVDQVINKAHNNDAPNIYKRRTGQTPTTLMDGKIATFRKSAAITNSLLVVVMTIPCRCATLSIPRYCMHNHLGIISQLAVLATPPVSVRMGN